MSKRTTKNSRNEPNSIAAASAAARPPQPTEHHAHSVYLAVQTLRCRHWSYTTKNSHNTSNLLETFLLSSSYPYLSRGDECSLFFCCRGFALSNGHDLFSRNKRNAYIITRIRPVRTLPRNNPGGERFVVLYQYTYTLSSSSRIPRACTFPTLGLVLDPYTHNY